SQMFRNVPEIHDGFAGEVVDGIQARNFRNLRPGAGIDKNKLALKNVVSCGYCVGIDETSVRAIKSDPVAFVDAFLAAFPPAQNNLLLLIDNPGQVDMNTGRLNSPACGIANVVGNLRAMDHGLRWSAAVVDAGSADQTLFDESDSP